MPGTWLASWTSDPLDRPVLLCLPQAGAGCGQFRPWQRRLGRDLSVVGVQLPGRESRWADPAPSDVDEVVDGVAGELVAALRPGCPLVVYGHSFGGLLGYEITRRLGTAHGRWPNALVVAACRPPHMWVGAGSGLIDDEDELVALLAARQLGADDLDEDSRELMLEVLRADARLSLSYVHRGDPHIPCPIEAWGGERDETVSADQLDGWGTYTAGSFCRRQFSGDHYFTAEHLDVILPMLRAMATDAAPAPVR